VTRHSLRAPLSLIVGTLTIALATRSRRVVGVEFDRALIPALREVLTGHSNVEVVQAEGLAEVSPPDLRLGQALREVVQRVLIAVHREQARGRQ